MDEKMINIAKINETVQGQEAEMIAFLEKLVNTESGISQIDGVNQIGQILSTFCQELGMKIRTIHHDQAGDLLIAEYVPENVKHTAPIVFSGHMDTVFKPGVTEGHHFRLLENQPGLAKGAGLMDMKGGLVIALYVIKNLISLGYSDHPLKMILVPDEETLHRYSNTRDEMARELADAYMLLNFEPSDHLDHIVVGRQGGMMMSMTVDGVPGHSGMEVKTSRSAIVELANKVVALEALTDIDRQKLINCGLINGGVSANTVPGQAKGNFSFRFPNESVKNEMLLELAEIGDQTYIEGTTTTYEIESWLDAMEYTDKVDQLADHYIETATQLDFNPLKKVESQGASDASIGSIVDIPTLDGLGIVGWGAHTLDETADLTSIVPKVCLSLHALISL